MRNISGPLIIFFVSILHGCASIVTGTDQKVTFSSEPEGATVTVSGRVLGKTPLTVAVDKGKHQPFTFEKEGYKTHTAQLSTTFNSWFWGNIVFGGPLGSSTDAASGAVHEFSPDQYFVTLTPVSSGGLSDSKSLKTKELLVLLGADVRMEIASGGGEKVSALLEVLEISEEDRATAIATLHELSLQNNNDLEFAISVLKYYDID